MEVEKLRMTSPTVRVIESLQCQPQEWQSGAEIFRATGILAGTLYPILHRMHSGRWLEAKWEDIDPAEAGRPRQRFYRLTAEGKRAANIELNKVAARRPGFSGEPSWAT